MTTPSQPERHVRVEQVMGTVVSFDVRGVAAAMAHDAVAAACRELHRIDATFSTYRPGSAIRRIDRGALALHDAPREVRWVLDRCEQLTIETGGWFDAHATGQLDPSAFVKGWAVQRASDQLARAGIYDHCITAGGDVACRGAAAPAESWRIGVQHPTRRDALAAIVALRGGAVATSGLYERGDHIIDPVHGGTPRDVLSVTVTGPDLALAVAYASAAFAMGTNGPSWTATLPGYEAMTIVADGTVLTTARFPLAAPSEPLAASERAAMKRRAA
jgi:thiamine biosynthesis lipoprotein